MAGWGGGEDLGIRWTATREGRQLLWTCSSPLRRGPRIPAATRSQATLTVQGPARLGRMAANDTEHLDSLPGRPREEAGRKGRGTIAATFCGGLLQARNFQTILSAFRT